MHFFQYQGGELFCEEVPISEIAEEVGTPFYLYSHRTLERHFRVFDEALTGLPHLVCYSAKANGNLAVLRTFIRLGSGVDVVSGGEIYRALRAGADPKRIVFSGVGKTEEEIRYGLREGILLFNVESLGELRTTERIAEEEGKRAPIALRVNPDIDPKTHPYVATGLKTSKFGIDVEEALEIYRQAKGSPHLEVKGISCHIGSQLTEVEPFVEALRKIKELYLRLQDEYLDLQYIDLGGGLGITYKDELPPHPEEYAEAIKEEAKGLECRFIFEPGRVLVGNAGVLITRVLYLKRVGKKDFVVVDAGMNDLIRPALYGSYHEVLPVKGKGGKRMVADLVGPICETGDFFAREREMPEPSPGDLLAIMGAGAYGFSMSSNYNARRRAAEVMVRGGEFFVIRERESYEDLVRGERVPPFLEDSR